MERVIYPGLETSPATALARDQMNAAGAPLYGGMVSFETESEELALRAARAPASSSSPSRWAASSR